MIVTLSTRRRDAFLRWRNALSAAVPPVLRQLLRARRRLASADMLEVAHEAMLPPQCLTPSPAVAAPGGALTVASGSRASPLGKPPHWWL